LENSSTIRPYMLRSLHLEISLIWSTIDRCTFTKRPDLLRPRFSR
jgi:hypothetical protein